MPMDVFSYNIRNKVFMRNWTESLNIPKIFWLQQKLIQEVFLIREKLKMFKQNHTLLFVLLLRWPTCWDRGWCLQRSSSASSCVWAASRTPTHPNRRARGATPHRRTGPNTTQLSGIMLTSSPDRGESGFYFIHLNQTMQECLQR